MRQRNMAWIALGAAFCLVASQAALSPSLGGLLRRNLARQAVEYTTLQVKVAPLGWIDLARGRLRGVEIRARGISFGGPRLARLDMRLERIQLAVGPLFLQAHATVVGLGPSRVLARVEAAALNEYRERAYPEVQAYFQIRDGRVGLVGGVQILGREVTLHTIGDLHAIQGDRLRYVPETIEISGRQVPASWLAAYGEKLALEIPLVLPLPLSLREVRLADGYADLVWTESTPAVQGRQNSLRYQSRKAALSARSSTFRLSVAS